MNLECAADEEEPPLPFVSDRDLNALEPCKAWWNIPEPRGFISSRVSIEYLNLLTIWQSDCCKSAAAARLRLLAPAHE